MIIEIMLPFLSSDDGLCTLVCVLVQVMGDSVSIYLQALCIQTSEIVFALTNDIKVPSRLLKQSAISIAICKNTVP